MSVDGQLRVASRVVTALILVAAVVVFFGPSGLGNRTLRGVLAQWRAQAIVKREWLELAAIREGSTAGVVAADGVVFFDYTCEYCRRIGAIVGGAVRRSDAERLRIRYLTRSGDAPARLAASLAVCSEHSGDFLTVHSRLMNTDLREVGTSIIDKIFEAGGIDRDAINRCLAHTSTEHRLSEDSTWSARLGIRGTPTFVSRRGRFYLGSDSTAIKRLLDEAVD